MTNPMQPFNIPDTFSLGRALDELKRRQGERYFWGEWKKPPSDSCQCSECIVERYRLVADLQKRVDAAECPEHSRLEPLSLVPDYTNLLFQIRQPVPDSAYAEYRSLPEPEPPKDKCDVCSEEFISLEPCPKQPLCPKHRDITSGKTDLIRQQFPKWDDH